MVQAGWLWPPDRRLGQGCDQWEARDETFTGDDGGCL